MDMINEAPALEDISYWAPHGSCRSLSILRLDIVHPVVSGNKWYKLRYNFAEALAQNKKAVLTFGGRHSNHLVATACAACRAGLKSIGIVRGVYDKVQSTATLESCREYGMELLPFTKAAYAVSQTSDGLYRLVQQFPDAFIMPEGGANKAGIRGAADIAAFIPTDTTDVCVATGTGTTLAGLNMGLEAHIRLHGFCAARNCDAATALIGQSSQAGCVSFWSAAGLGFGKWNDAQIAFMKTFYRQTGIPLDIVYTGKMMLAVQEMLLAHSFGRNSKIICIHTGGLQGNPAGLFPERNLSGHSDNMSIL